jgi:hypothetical protein
MSDTLATSAAPEADKALECDEEMLMSATSAAPEADKALECDEEMPIFYNAEQGDAEFEQMILQDQAKREAKKRQRDKQKSKSKPKKQAEEPLRSSSGRILKPSRRVASSNRVSPTNIQDKDDNVSSTSQEMEPPTPVIANKRRRRPPPPQENDDDDDDSHEDTEDDRDLVAASASLRYNWDPLQLGTKLGSAAYNAYIQKQQNSSQYPLTSHETLRLVQSFRPPTILPPLGSSLVGVVQHLRLENQYLEAMEDEGASDDEETGTRYPFHSLARLYQTMLSQDVDTDHTQYRRHVQYLSPEACVQEMQDISKRAEALKEHEQRVLQTGRDLGLYTEQTTRDISRFLGYTKQQRQEAEMNSQNHG